MCVITNGGGDIAVVELCAQLHIW